MERERFRYALPQNELHPVPTLFPARDWTFGPTLSMAVSDNIKSVKINGIVYVGGGWGFASDNEHIVLTYNLQSHQWHYSLLPYFSKCFGMTAVNNKLVLVGGMDRKGCDRSEVGEWNPDTIQWTWPYPPMPTPRTEPSATSYKNWLVVAGGYHIEFLNTVEVLNLSNMQWSTKPSTPTPWQGMKTVVIDDTWYLMGGRAIDYLSDIYRVSLEDLVLQPASADSSIIWQKLPSLNYIKSSAGNVGGYPVAVGGLDGLTLIPLRTVRQYIPQSNSWDIIGQIPLAQSDCTCINIAEKLLVMGGCIRSTELNLFVPRSTVPLLNT